MESRTDVTLVLMLKADWGLLSMASYLGTTFILSAAIGLVSCAAGAEEVRSKYALLIAVTTYEHAEMNRPEALQYPEEDAKALKELLETSGYHVETLLGPQAKQQEIRRSFQSLSRQGAANGVALVGLFGHGVEAMFLDDNGNAAQQGCFCPYDTSVRIAKDSQGRKLFGDNGQELLEPDPDTLVTLAELMSALRVARAGSRVVLADCCRSTPNRSRGRSFGQNFRVQDLPESTAVFFGCSPQEKAFENRQWGHGAFTKCLLDELPELVRTGGATAGTLADRLKTKVHALVASASNGRDQQTPRVFFTDTFDLQLTLPLARIPGPTSFGVPDLTRGPANPPGTEASGDLTTGPGKEKSVRLGNTEMTFCWIPAGVATLGSPATEQNRDLGDLPEDPVRFETPGFWLAKFETTEGQWGVLSNRTAIRSANLPKGNVSYLQIKSFIQSLNNRFDVSAALGKGHFSLPSEDQWEYACRGGLGNARAFYWGPTANGREANLNGAYPYPSNSAKGPNLQRATAVGSYEKITPHPWNLCDMHGNVWEFCERRGGGTPPVIRGGSHFDPGIWQCRAAYRSEQDPAKPFGNMGFRIYYGP